MEDSDYEENWDWTIVLDTDLFVSFSSLKAKLDLKV